MEATVAERGQITLPKAVRDALGLTKGSVLKVELEGSRIVLRKSVDDAISRVRGKFALDAIEPAREQFGGARVERGETASHARLALRQHQLRAAGQKHRRADQGQGEPPFEQSWNGHTLISTIRFQTV